MMKDTFIVGSDASGRKFVTQKMDELDKNHRGEDNKNFDTSGEGCTKLMMNFVLSCHVTVIFRHIGPYDRNKSNFRRSLYCPEMQVRLELV